MSALKPDSASVPPSQASGSLSELRHDLRTPLNQIIGYSEMLEEEAEESGQTASVLDLKKIQTAARRLLELINTRLVDSAMQRLGSPGLIVGAMPGTQYTTEKCDVPAGARLFVLCDGCYEITRPDGTMMTFDEFENFIRAHGDEPDGLQRLLDWVQAERGTEGLEDDFSIVRLSF